MRKIGAVVVLVLLGLAAVAPAVFGSCAAATPEEHFTRAEVVFYGRVVSERRSLGHGGTIVTFAVERVLKGAAGPEFALWQASGPAPFPMGLLGANRGSSVDVDFAPGTSYLVFARRYDGRWSTSVCDGTVPVAALDGPALRQAGLDALAAHFPGRPPDAAIPINRALPPAPLLPWAALAVPAGVAAWLAWRRLGPRRAG